MFPGWLSRLFAASALVFLGASAGVLAFDKADRARAREMVDSIQELVKNSYYDPHFQGIDLDEHFAKVREKLETADSYGQAFAIIAQSLLDFHDSHTYFLPPSVATSVDYGWRMQAVGDRCYVVAVDPVGDAAARGLRPGDQLLKIQLTTPTRATMWRTKYLFYSLYPQPVVTLAVRDPEGERRELVVQAKVTTRPRVLELRPQHLNRPITIHGDPPPPIQRESVRIGDVALWKLTTFDFPAADVDRLVDGATKNARSLVLDLRGNTGGTIETLERIAGRLFDRNVTLAERVARQPIAPVVARSKRPFTGRLIVLVDSETSSAAEILARAVQIEGRGAVIGDRTAGRVMQSRIIPVPLGEGGAVSFFYVSVTEADVIMTDGKSLEHSGVVPDELVLPSPADLATGRDPVLARAASLMGVALEPQSAGAMFPVQW